jgi:tetratricopeptide (TPR) repeat protein
MSPPCELSSQLLRSTTGCDDDAIVSALVLGVSWLQGSEQMCAPPSWLADCTMAAVQALPPQHSPQLNTHPAAAWLLLVSLADAIGAFEIARVLLNEFERLLDADTDNAAGSDEAHAARARSAANFSAIASARRGRLLRQQGDAESAAEWYRAGLRKLRKLPREDGWATCTLGLAVIAQGAGNFPQTMRYCRAVLREAATIGQHSVYGAHLTLAVAHRRRGELQRALHHAWLAFELAGTHDGDRQQALINVAEISLALGQAAAARNGFLLAMKREQPERNRIPAHVGLLEAEVALWQAGRDVDIFDLRSRIDTLLCEARACRQPHERIKALLGALDAAVTIGWTEQARHIDHEVTVELNSAVHRGSRYHEFEFRHATIIAPLSASVAPEEMSPTGRERAPNAYRLGRGSRATMNRLLALTSMADVS